MSRHERRDGLTTWIVRRQVDGAIIGTYEYVIDVLHGNDGAMTGIHRDPGAPESRAVLILGEDRARTVADWLNTHGDRDHPWHPLRARP